MQNKYWVTFSAFGAILIAIVLVLSASTPPKQKPTCCKKVSKDCIDGIQPVVPGQTTLDNLSHQFIAIPVSIY
ncbi:MAG: hypothetical protein H7Y01_15240 [Ferruginibacter sp.]|nr:hypothetical protein [Chitinophagaceae bacterium]